MSIETLTHIESEWRDSKTKKNADGSAKKYESVSIKVESRGERFISGFGSEATKNWRPGDQIEIIITESTSLDKQGRPYLNFEVPNAKPVRTPDPVPADNRLNQIQTKLGSMDFKIDSIIRTLAFLSGAKEASSDPMPSYPTSTGQPNFNVPEYPEEEINPADVPF